MKPVNNCIVTNQTFQPSDDASLKDNYGITKEYEKNYPKDSALVLSLVRSVEQNLRAGRELANSSNKLTNSIAELENSTKELDTRLDRIIESSEKNTQALRKLADSSSEMKEITSNIANIAKRFLNPVRNGVYFLTRPTEPVEVLYGKNSLSIEYTPENTIPNTDQTSGNVKKKFASLLIFFAVSGGLYFLHAREQKI